MKIRFAKAIGNAQKESEWDLMMAAENQTEGNLFVRLGKKGERLTISSKNTVSLRNDDLGRLILNGTIVMENFTLLLQEAIIDYPDYNIEVAFKDSIVWICVNGEHLFGYQPDYIIIDAHGDEGWEYYGNAGELNFRIKELFSQADQQMIIQSFILG
jgi:hypothetical protein